MSAAARVDALQDQYGNCSAEEMLNSFIKEEFGGKVALVSSFGIEAALLLEMVSRIDPATPVIFLDTRKLFPETLTYKNTLISHLGLTNVQTYYPDYADVARDDPEGNLWQTTPNSCCYIRKVKTLNRALDGYDAWITGRKRFHGGTRTQLPLLEYSEGRVKLNPLATWGAEEIQAAFDARNIPMHPLLAQGYTSVGCLPCTALPVAGADIRSGRWQGQDKDECGIHLGADGRFKRTGSE